MQNIYRHFTVNQWLFIIFFVTSIVEVFTMLATGKLSQALVRLVLLFGLFFAAYKRANWASYVLALLYALGGVIAFVASKFNPMSIGFWVLSTFGMFGFASACFFVKLPQLRMREDKQADAGIDLASGL